jgi:pilus assembly protein CpaF
MIPREVHERTLLVLLAPVARYLQDPTVAEVLINGPDEVIIERAGKLERTDARFASREALLAALRNIAQFVGRPIGPHHSILEARLPDGSRVEAVLPPASPDGPHVAIRRFPSERLTIDRLVAAGALSEGAAQLLARLVRARQNILVAGGTGSGKTSLLNALSSFIAEDERIVVIEDARELQLQQRHVVQLEARPADARGRGQVTIRELFKATLRLRPDRVVVGEVRGGEAFELVQAMTSGHGGCMATLHASHPHDAMRRLETLAMLAGVELPLHALRAQVAAAVQIVVQTSRLARGGRGITHISEVVGVDAEHGYRLVELHARSQGVSHGHGEAPLPATRTTRSGL